MVSGYRDNHQNRERVFGRDQPPLGKFQSTDNEREANLLRDRREIRDGDNNYSSRRDRSSSGSSPPRLERWERRIQDAKKSHRPRLRSWGRDRFGIEGSRAAATFEALNWGHHSGRERDGDGFVQGIPRESRDDLTPEDFWEHYERRRLPVVVSGIPSQERWRASEQWTLEQLGRRLASLTYFPHIHTSLITVSGTWYI